MRDSLRRFKAGVFQALANPTRIALVELLRDEAGVHDRILRADGGIVGIECDRLLAQLLRQLEVRAQRIFPLIVQRGRQQCCLMPQPRFQ